MDIQTSLSGRKFGTFQKICFGIMSFLTLFCILMSVIHNVFRDSYILLINSICIISLVFMTVLTGFLASKKEETTLPRRYFMLFLLNLYAGAFFLTLVSCLYQIPKYAQIIRILNTLCYFFVMLVFWTLWLYQKQFIRESVVTHAVTVLIASVVIIYTFILVINLFKPVIFSITDQSGYSYMIKDYFSVAASCFCLLLLCVATFTSNLSRNRKFSFFCCVFFPCLFSTIAINHELFKWGIYILGLVSFTVILPLYLIFFNAHDELENDILRHEKEQTQLRVSAMMSQMQPHFLYNSLAVIEALCEEDPKLAAEATNAFSKYLRENMNFADKSKPISFSEELNHIKTYVWLEELRFPNKLRVEYDIECDAFPVPALSVQPMVENAIKHGICKTKSGGTVRIRSSETDAFYCISVSDDGAGFDVQKTIDDTKLHLGINNTRSRLHDMVGGSLDIESVPGKGTEVTIKIPKN